jgi:hypothetical protein
MALPPHPPASCENQPSTDGEGVSIFSTADRRPCHRRSSRVAYKHRAEMCSGEQMLLQALKSNTLFSRETS